MAHGGSTEPAASPSRRGWVSEPEQTDEVIRGNTGRGWDEWRELIDAWSGNVDGHAAIARYVEEQHGVDGWWAQSVTVGYERIIGRRLPHQRSDGTFSASRSATIRVDAERLRARLLTEAGRAELFPGEGTELRSRPTSRNVRLRIGPGVAEINIAARDDGKAKVVVAHEKLPEAGDVQRWKSFWGAWLDDLDAP